MKLSRPLVARKPNVTATVFIKKDKFKLELRFANSHQEPTTHTFIEEDTLFAYLEKFEILPEDFKLAPF